MTLQSNPLRWVLPLQHMAKVKTVEVLWRNSGDRHALKEFPANSRLHNPRRQPMSKYLEKDVDRLPIPEVMKDELKVSAVEMISDGITWLILMIKELRDNGHQQDENYTIMYTYFVDNFSWKNSGCVDGRKMLQSYVRNRETIDFDTWKMLCDYCIEDDIIRFSKTMDWRNCRYFSNSSPHCLYWYWRIYGKFPTKKMFSSDIEYSRFKRRQYNENEIVQEMLKKSVHCDSFPAGITSIKYFQNQRIYEAQLDELLSNRGIFNTSRTTIVYILGQMKNTEALVKDIRYASFLFNFLVRWPWNMFTDNWMDILEDKNVLQSHFLDIFESMGIRIFVWKGYELNEKQYQLLCNKVVYEPFKRLWTLFKRKFGIDEYSASEIFQTVYKSNDITFCKILFDMVEPSQRIYFLRILGDLAQKSVRRELGDEDFCAKFLKDVLKSDEERKIFREIVSNRRLVDPWRLMNSYLHYNY